MIGQVEDGPNPVDVHVGSRIRLRRKVLGMSQEKLAEKLGLTFQQVQKYERGANRVSASKLYQAAQALQAPISYFFEGLAEPGVETGTAPDPTAERAVSAFLTTPEGLELASVFPRVRDASVRRQMLELVRAVVRADGGPSPN
jgi:transcriptional regulator with XRE-family HTH domain